MKRKTSATDADYSHLPSKKSRTGNIHDRKPHLPWQNSTDSLSADWVFSNVHICNDLKWFTELTPFQSVVSSSFGSETMLVKGVGTVDLPVKRDPDLRGPQAHHILRLTNVLYTPSSDFNILGQPIFELVPLVTIRSTGKKRGTLVGKDGNPVAFFSPTAPLYCLRLSGPPVGPRLAPTKFKPGVAYHLMVSWPGIERARWNARGQQGEKETEPDQRTGDEPYTTEEKAWLKKHYKGEYKFLMSYGLSIYDEEERAEGRAIMRSMASADEDGDETGEETERREEDDEGEDEEDEDDEFGHLADYLFNKKELAWINKHYQNSAAFMLSYGLKFYNDEDCADAKALVRSIMSEGD
ncbi:hypothetical protein GGI35DRAFT_433915 [Trichoderma velutinum]